MSVDWPVVRLGDYIDTSLGKMLDQTKNKGVEQPYLGNSNVRWGQFDLANLSQMKFEENESERYGIKKGDLIVCEGGEPGRCAIWSGDYPDMKIQKALHRIRPNPSLNNYYLYYWFLFSGSRGLLEPYFTGTTIKHLTGKALKNLEIKLPDLEHQEFVADVLTSLDNKIELNRQTNQTLEEMAQAVFKSWFVDFDPTRARIKAIENGQDPTRAAMAAIAGKAVEQLDTLSADQIKSLTSTAALFPDAFEPSELGEIPAGWHAGELSDIAQFSTDRVDVSNLSQETYVSTENMLEGKRGITSASSLPAVKTVPSFSTGHILISNIRPYFKKIWLACFQGGRSNDVLGLEAIEAGGTEYLYNLLYQDKFFDFMMTTSKGAKMPRGDKDAIMGWSCVHPKLDIKKAYSSLVSVFYQDIEARNVENRSLEQLRDKLLPKLLSGEIELSEAS